ncbi:unnamed protein product [Effrenium voratum]|uniref:Uncharacterized protein n=1 Tax=Effrenium voratum TaxID=2562239 RepID=A0AA36J3C4_9DINO|nr:unnamed protein product [Effrenium voratum]
MAAVAATWAVAVVWTARCPGAVGAVEGLRGPAAAKAGRLNVRTGACGRKWRGCVCRGVKQPCFGFHGDKRPSCCAKCKLEGMVDIRHPRCNCGRAIPCFGMPQDARPSCCAKCKLEGMVDIRSAKCNCGRVIPCFGMPDDTRASHCAECKLEGMVDIRNRRCNCGKAQPAFGMPEDARPSCCAKCKLEGMVDIRSPKCNCGRAFPSSGMPEDARASCCAKCRLEDMVDIKHPRCYCGRARPHFGMPNDARPCCCAKCKLEGMVDIRNPKCSVCGKNACYPDAAGKPRRLCAGHSAEVGAHVLSAPSWSRAAGEFLDLLEEEQGFKFPFRQRFDEAAGAWSGEEFAGLVPNRALRPDAHDPQRREASRASQLHLRGRQDVPGAPSRDFRAPGPLPGAKSARLLRLGARVHRVAEAGSHRRGAAHLSDPAPTHQAQLEGEENRQEECEDRCWGKASCKLMQAGRLSRDLEGCKRKFPEALQDRHAESGACVLETRRSSS